MTADDPRAGALLARWDELSEERLEELARHPAFGPKLAHLRAAEAWLGRGLAARKASEAARPSAEELFDWATAGGAGTAVAPSRARELETYLARHPEEGAWVAALRRRPPSPLTFEPEEPLAGEAAGSEDEPYRRAPRGTARLARWLPLAAAASVLAIGLSVVNDQRDRFGWPADTELRSALAQPLHFPRGRVLAAPEGGVGLYANEPLFELAAVPGASGYRVLLRRHAGGPFDEGEVVLERSSAEPSLAGEPLAAGHYAWEAFATVDRLERSLGTLEFRVVEDAAALERLARLDLLSQVARLVREGFVTDARHRARLLPEGPARAAILGSEPER